ncbi:DUF4245 domain-containing protein [Streptomyces varsoviensis]|uniref:DUF4245 domain-containing protein n=1 Tax=Streptomyces varsoviensis TaxID=67373 RepID=A0ABR5IZ78_9ACTN|nr:DUF4245 domain-containing protein [Streptomyces varsoviensis]KOG86472.1 hypothetical protein ADK38_30845 [Streptomyces varsoviensis]
MRDYGRVAGRSAKKQTVRNMILSLAVIVPVAVVSYVFIPHDQHNDPIKTVSYRVELDTARRAAPYPVAAPVGLPEGWRATSVSYDGDGKEGAAWHLGFLDPEKQYVAVEQSDGPSAVFIDSVTRQAAKTGKTERVDGATWDLYEGEKYDALVRTERGVTTVVTGTAPHGQLTRMAAALKAEKTKTKPDGTPDSRDSA